MRVVKQQLEMSTGRAPPPDTRDQGGRIPLVNNDQIGTVEDCVQIELRAVKAEIHARYQGRGITQCGLPAILQRVDAAPALARLADQNLMTEPGKFTRDAAQEVNVAVVPAGSECVI